MHTDEDQWYFLLLLYARNKSASLCGPGLWTWTGIKEISMKTIDDWKKKMIHGLALKNIKNDSGLSWTE